MSNERLTLVIAAHNEAMALPLLHPRLRAVLDGLDGIEGRIVYVDDGSTDATWQVMQALAAADDSVGLLRLSRNFGKEAALTAGLDFVDGGAAMILDADGQDPPELIPQFVALWRQGYDNIYGTRQERDGETWLKRGTSSAFYRVIGRLSKTPIPADTGDFRLLSPRALQALGQLRERHRFMKGLFGWVGFRRKALPYHRHARMVGDTKFGFWKLWNFALEGITSFSTAPLRAATYLGLLTASAAFVFGAWVVVKAALYGDRVAGYPTMMAVILFLGGVQLIALGLIGEYLGRLYEESKQRPLYLVDTWHAPFVADSAVHPIGGGQRDDHGTTAVGRQVP
ncbi:MULTISPECIES: glycosyltransferase family 2 protein [Stenotrophomonas]|jgi:glycosyltransferase involved in cell wall biosynthesis|uniref:Glycosyltransferase family 2 protein n=1 Tax=Stenotrophomonas aracearum TaxID=3003272 RepID=A0ABY9YBQ6_9GAMM|nr:MULTISPECIES: glycosyltransferase family 2 protein [unclassified Stenotrophomonas]WNH47843.1 glycosyltransferase family 2 protein [Stenotrophomonas sp. A5588]